MPSSEVPTKIINIVRHGESGFGQPQLEAVNRMVDGLANAKTLYEQLDHLYQYYGFLALGTQKGIFLPPGSKKNSVLQFVKSLRFLRDKYNMVQMADMLPAQNMAPRPLTTFAYTDIYDLKDSLVTAVGERFDLTPNGQNQAKALGRQIATQIQEMPHGTTVGLGGSPELRAKNTGILAMRELKDKTGFKNFATTTTNEGLTSVRHGGLPFLLEKLDKRRNDPNWKGTQEVEGNRQVAERSQRAFGDILKTLDNPELGDIRLIVTHGENLPAIYRMLGFPKLSDKELRKNPSIRPGGHAEVRIFGDDFIATAANGLTGKGSISEVIQRFNPQLNAGKI